jgi:hypothetical protein
LMDSEATRSPQPVDANGGNLFGVGANDVLAFRRSDVDLDSGIHVPRNVKFEGYTSENPSYIATLGRCRVKTVFPNKLCSNLAPEQP